MSVQTVYYLFILKGQYCTWKIFFLNPSKIKLFHMT